MRSLDTPRAREFKRKTMNDRMLTIGWCTLLLLTLAAVCQVFYYLPALPAEVASHFDANGNPNGGMSKSAFATLMIALDVSIGLTFLGIGRAVKLLPVSLINIPNREYWLAGEQRESSLKTIAGFCYWAGIPTLLLLMIVFQLTVIANLRNANLDSTVFWGTMIGYVIVLVGSCVWLLRRFSNTEHFRG